MQLTIMVPTSAPKFQLTRSGTPGQQRGQGAIDQTNQHGHPSSQVTPMAEFREYYKLTEVLGPGTRCSLRAWGMNAPRKQKGS